jgi:hypothetical protein
MTKVHKPPRSLDDRVIEKRHRRLDDQHREAVERDDARDQRKEYQGPRQWPTVGGSTGGP